MARLVEILKGLWLRSMMHRALLVAPPVALLAVGGLHHGGRAHHRSIFHRQGRTRRHFPGRAGHGDDQSGQHGAGGFGGFGERRFRQRGLQFAR